MKKIAILGAGISGLSLAWFLRNSGVEITILEKENRPGGWIQTVFQNGFLFEQGPRSCRSKGNGAATLGLIEELGMQGQVIPASSAAHHRYLWVDGKLRCLPNGFFSFVFSPLMRGITKAFFKDWRTLPADHDETIYDFISRRFSADIAERLVDPLTLGIYAGDIRQLSIRSCFPQLVEWEQSHGSVLRGAIASRRKSHMPSPYVRKIQQQTSLFTLQRGIESLPFELANRLGPIYGAEVKKIEIANEVHITLCDQTTFTVDHIVSTLPSTTSNQLFGSQLTQPFASVAVVNFGYHHQMLPHEGFGHLIPSAEQENTLGVVWDSSAFPQQNQSPQETRLTAMIGGTKMTNFNQYKAEDFIEMALKTVYEHLGIGNSPNAIAVKIAHNAIPQYLVGHQERLAKLAEESNPRVSFLGSSFGGVSVNDCIANAKKLAGSLLNRK